LKRRVARMKQEAKEAELEPLMPAMETITRRIRLERLVVLERVVKDIERREALAAAAIAQNAAEKPTVQNSVQQAVSA